MRLSMAALLAILFPRDTSSSNLSHAAQTILDPSNPSKAALTRAAILASVGPEGHTPESSGSIRALNTKPGASTTSIAGSPIVSLTIQRKLSGKWVETAKLTASDGAANDEFGRRVAISSNVAIVGVYYDDDNGTDSGSAYIYEKNLTSGEWVETAKLTAADGAAEDRFGYSVAVSGNTVIVGAYYDDDKGNNSGSVYIYKKNSTSGEWVKTAKLTPADGAADDQFGNSVAVSNNTVIVGSWRDDDKGGTSGSAYIYEENPISGEWVETAKLTASDGASSDYFGWQVAVSGNTVIVAAYGDDDQGSLSGSAYIYEKNLASGAWVETAKLKASDGAADDEFGRSVAVSYDTVIVGAYKDDDNGSSSGSAYIYEKNLASGAWVETAKLKTSDGAVNDNFGRSVAVSYDTVIIGANGEDDNGSSSGSAYIYKKNSTNGEWVKDSKLTASDGASSDYFGWHVAVSGSTVIVGAYGDDDKASSSGSAYIYEPAPLTASPSKSPSASPSASPSVSPSTSPSSSPSASPSASPSKSPSASPSKSPIASPSTSKASKNAKGGKGT